MPPHTLTLCTLCAAPFPKAPSNPALFATTSLVPPAHQLHTLFIPYEPSAQDSAIRVDTSKWSFGRDDDNPDTFREGLAGLLQLHNVRLSDLFAQLDDDGSSSLSREEFADAMWELGYRGPLRLAGEVFDVLDADGSGKVGFDELNGWVHGRANDADAAPSLEQRMSLNARARASFDAEDPPWDAARLQRELNHVLVAERLRAVDVVRSWDRGTRNGSETAGDAIVSKREFSISMKKLLDGEGADLLWYAMVRESVGHAYHAFTGGKDGNITMSELVRWLDPHMRAATSHGPVKKLSKPPAFGGMGAGVVAASQAAAQKTRRRVPLWAPRVPPPPPMYTWNGRPLDQTVPFVAARMRHHLKGTLMVRGVAPRKEPASPAMADVEQRPAASEAAGEGRPADGGGSLTNRADRADTPTVEVDSRSPSPRRASPRGPGTTPHSRTAPDMRPRVLTTGEHARMLREAPPPSARASPPHAPHSPSSPRSKSARSPSLRARSPSMVVSMRRAGRRPPPPPPQQPRLLASPRLAMHVQSAKTDAESGRLFPPPSSLGHAQLSTLTSLAHMPSSQLSTRFDRARLRDHADELARERGPAPRSARGALVPSVAGHVRTAPTRHVVAATGSKLRMEWMDGHAVEVARSFAKGGPWPWGEAYPAAVVEMEA